MVVNCSFQVISKWERGEGFPDVQMIIALARYFGVTTDYLLGIEDPSADEINSVVCTWEENNKKGFHAENEALLRKAIKNHPKDYALFLYLAATLEYMGDGTVEAEKYLKESIMLQKIVINESQDPEQVYCARYNLCFSLAKLGRMQEAMEYAVKLPGYYKTRENAMLFLSQTPEDKEKIAASSINPVSWAIIKHLLVLYEIRKDSRYLDKANQIFCILKDELTSDMRENLYKSIRKRKNSADNNSHC